MDFTTGVASPEVRQHSGNIIYVDNRPSITRSSNQRRHKSYLAVLKIMPQQTNLSVAPYFDDFDATNDYHKVLFELDTQFRQEN